ncbi:hypothetical protein SPI_02834 [Niveomyces insectorum RCEF 264]|uniref:WHIM1 domain-containing protein n=1 Tax=Niveomyces insectorum RCEF 264 TaxID=1081102 RepID=A0A167WU23_9HYPO|nr:hypothetical protein SPI_02834 [Niveomyces insectorum RCEF 264]
MADDDSSDLSSVSSQSSLSPPPSDDESDIQLRKEKGILKFFHKLSPKGGASSASTRAARDESPPTPPKRQRAPSPPHEYVLADNQDIAFIVMFRNRFAEAFPKNLANFGPQELERDVVGSAPGDRVEYFLCALLKLLLNRQQDVKPGHYHRALEEAVLSHKSQWVVSWKENPLGDGKTFTTMSPTERLTLLRALVLWAMASSKAVRDIIDHAYKGKRKDDDSNIVLSVQPWGSDSDKRRYYLIEGRDDTAFRIYRESNPAGFINRTWWSVAGSIDEAKALIEKLETNDGGPKAKKLAKLLKDEIPRFEATEEKRRRREYRQQRRDQFKRPEPGFSLYEGRTRGKRIKYTYSDDEDFLTDSTGPRRSTRHTRTHTPAEAAGPLTTASGRQIRAPNRTSGGPSASASIQGDAAAYDQTDADEDQEISVGPTGRPRRSAAANHGMNGWPSRKQTEEPAYDEYDSQAEDEDGDDDMEDNDDDAGDEHIPEDDADDDEDDEENFDESKDAMLLDEEDEEVEVAGGRGGDGDDGNDGDDGDDDGARSAVVKLSVHAVLNQETGKWKKAQDAEAKPKPVQEEAREQPQASNGAAVTTPANKDVDIDGDGDITMTGSTVQSSEATAISPGRTGGEAAATDPAATRDNKLLLPTPPAIQAWAGGKINNADKLSTQTVANGSVQEEEREEDRPAPKPLQDVPLQRTATEQTNGTADKSTPPQAIQYTNVTANGTTDRHGRTGTTPEKENDASAAALAYRSSPEKTHQPPPQVGALGSSK